MRRMFVHFLYLCGYILVEKICLIIASISHFEVRHWLDSSHGTTSDGNLVVDGFISGSNVRLTNGIFHFRAGAIAIGDSEVDQFSMHLEQHAVNWPGWKHVADPVKIQLSNISPCDSSDSFIELPSIVFGLAAFPMYGHVMFNGHSNLIDTIWRSSFEVGNLRLYAAVDHPKHMISTDENSTFLNFGENMDSAFSRLTQEGIVHSYHALLQSSYNTNYCFQKVTIGLSGGLDHYNKSVPSSQWHKYGDFVAQLFHIQEATSPDRSTPYQYRNDDRNHRHGRSCVITMLSRATNRRTLNEAQLMDAAHQLGCLPQLVVLENLAFEDQIKFMRNSTILFGVDGSGLLNAAFMRRCTSVIRYLPWGCCDPLIGNLQDKGKNFQEMAEKVGGGWISFCVTNRSATVFHDTHPRMHEIFQLLATAAPGTEAALGIGHQFTNSERQSFFLNQDSIVDARDFERSVMTARAINSACLTRDESKSEETRRKLSL